MSQPISQERREDILKKMLSLGNKSISSLARQEGVSKSTLYKWRDKYLLRSNKLFNSKNFSGESKFISVLETAALSEVDKNRYCREKGIYPEQLEEWRLACIQANATLSNKAKTNSAEIKALKKQIKILEKELKYKDKALSETAALLVLRKKLNALWEKTEKED